MVTKTQFENVTFLPVFVLVTEWSLVVSVKTLARDVLKSVVLFDTKHNVSEVVDDREHQVLD